MPFMITYLKIKSLLRLTILVPLALFWSLGSVYAAGIAWQGWDERHFERAGREQRLILLNLEAVWCHWCHVMEKNTYPDPTVVAVIQAHYIPVKTDQDARPDLGKRYEEYGWPATIVFDASGREIVKLRGYIEPARMAAILSAIAKDPTPATYMDALRDQPTEISSQAALSDEIRDELKQRFYRTHDNVLGGLNQDQKFMDKDSVELALSLARRGDKKADKMARQTLDGALNLIDPVWGGAYQYSTDGDWRHKHFEKIMSVQSDYLRLYALAWRVYGDVRYRAAAHSIQRYVSDFLTSSAGTFYVSQDADVVPGQHSEDFFALSDAERRGIGIPRVDTQIYSRENGRMSDALTHFYAATGDSRYLQQAVRAVKWAMANRALPNGGFRHVAKDAAGPFLDDNLAMARAFLNLYAATAERQWLARAQETARFIDRNFRHRDGGFISAVKRGVLDPRRNVDENIGLARMLNQLAHYSGKASYRDAAEYAMRYLATDEVATYRRTEPGILLAEAELTSEPVHITIVGGKRDAAAKKLYVAALAYAIPYRRIEWWDRKEGKLANADVAYPMLARPAAFICTNRICSSPIYDAAEIATSADRLASN